MITPELLHYLSAGFTILLGAFGVGLGQGIAGTGSQDAFIRQPVSNLPIFRMMVIGLALIESGGIIALVTSLLILFSNKALITWECAFAEIGMSLAVGFAAVSISIASSFVVKAASNATARQPFFAAKILTFMLISQSIIEAPVIFAFIVALLIKINLTSTMSMVESLKLFSAGLVVAIGCIGPSIGQALFARTANTAIGLNKNVYGKIFPFALIHQAMIETPMVFCVLIALITIFLKIPPTLSFTSALKFPLAAIAMGIGALGVSVGMGYSSSRGCKQIPIEPKVYTPIIQLTLLSAAFIESVIIYDLIICLLLITR